MKKKILFVVVKLKNMIKKKYAELVEQTVTVAVQINLFYSIIIYNGKNVVIFTVK